MWLRDTKTNTPRTACLLRFFVGHILESCLIDMLACWDFLLSTPSEKLSKKKHQNAQRVGLPCRQMPPWIRTKSPGKKQGFHWVVLFEAKRNIARFCWISCLNTRKLNTLYFGPLSLRNMSFVSMFRIIRNSFCFPHHIYIYTVYIYYIHPDPVLYQSHLPHMVNSYFIRWIDDIFGFCDDVLLYLPAISPEVSPKNDLPKNEL